MDPKIGQHIISYNNSDVETTFLIMCQCKLDSFNMKAANVVLKFKFIGMLPFKSRCSVVMKSHGAFPHKFIL